MDWKNEARKQWNNRPCGSLDVITEDLDYFLSIEKNRYENYAPWMKETFRYSSYKDKNVLEIGYGQGTDLVQFALAGATCFGVDITERHYQLASKNLEVRGLKASLFLEDAAALHFPDAYFDTVYSFGVLHHTPDTERCFREAHRVLKPGGEFIVALYHKNSAFYWIEKLLVEGLIKGRLFTLGHEGLLATVECGADGKKIKPLVKLYTRNKLRSMLSQFSTVDIIIRHLDPEHFNRLGRLLPQSMIEVLATRCGWYIIARAIK